MAKVNYEKAWKTLKENLISEYIKVCNVIEQHPDSNTIQIRRLKQQYLMILQEMESVDGTHEFSNLLHDMNREDK